MKNLSIISNGLLLIILFFSSCENKEQHPVLNTSSITNITASKFHICANVIEKGDIPILDYGFVYSLSSVEMERVTALSNKVSLGSVIKTDGFCEDLTIPNLNSYPSNCKCFVSAYITNEKGTLFANALSAEIIRIEASTIVPVSAKVNDTIVIHGNNFESSSQNNNVKFNDVIGTVISASSSELKVIVPAQINLNYGEQYIKVHIESGSQVMELNENFTLSPSPFGFSPTRGNWNTSVTINGNALNNTTVFINDIPLRYTHTGDNNRITFQIPHEINTNMFKLYLNKDGVKTEVPGGYFTMEKPRVSSFTPQVCYPGSTITIQANNLNPLGRYNTLQIGTEILSRLNTYPEQQYTLPSNLQEGEYTIFINNGVDKAEFPSKLKIVKAEITGISPTTGYINSVVTLSGNNFYEIPKIQFGNTSNFKAFYMDSSTVKFRVPGIIPATYDIFAEFAASRVNCPKSFTLVSPIVSSFSPIKGEPRSTLTISGEGFGDGSGITIMFGYNSSYLLSVSDKEIKVQVPSWIYTGKYPVKVWINGYLISDSFTFEIP